MSIMVEHILVPLTTLIGAKRMAEYLTRISAVNTSPTTKKFLQQRSGFMGRPTFVAEEVTKAPWHNIKGELCHEFDARGNHRITLNGAVGVWANYADICFFKTQDDRLFAGTTDYWTNVLPEIFEMQSVVPRTLSDVYRE